MNKKLLKILHFLPYFPPHSGGVEMYAKEWAENYAREHGEVCIVTFSVGQTLGSRHENGYDVIVLPAFDIVHSFPFPAFWFPSFWRGLWKAKKWNADIIHTHTRFFLSSFIGGIFAKIFHKPWIHIEHGSGFVVSGNKCIEIISKIYDRTIGFLVLNFSDSVITVSEACELFVRETFGIKNTKTIYRGIANTISHTFPSKDEIHIGFVGRLVDLKGVDILIQSFSQIQRNYTSKTPLKLVIVGDGPEREKLEKLCESLTLSSSISFLGQKSIEEIRSVLLPSFQIFVNPSLQEGLPTTVMEALVAGCSVIATDVGGTREIHRYASFILIEPKNTEMLTKALEDSLREIQSQTYIRTPQSLFPWKQTIQEFNTIYNLQLLGKKH